MDLFTTNLYNDNLESNAIIDHGDGDSDSDDYSKDPCIYYLPYYLQNNAIINDIFLGSTPYCSKLFHVLYYK